MSVIWVEVNGEVSTLLKWNRIIAVVPAPDSIEECIVYHSTFFESCIELENYYFFNITIWLQVDN